MQRFAAVLLAVVSCLLLARQTAVAEIVGQEGADAGSQSVEPGPRYSLSFEEAQAHYIDITLRTTVSSSQPLELEMATWTPGSYLIREYARNITRISAADADGEPLEIEKTTKNRWRIESAGEGEVTVQYRLYCREMSVRTNFVDSEFAVLNGAATFLTVSGAESLPHQVKIELPNGWQRAVSALDQPADVPANVFLARDFDHLVDSPILIGNPRLYPMQVDGKQLYLVNLGDDELWNGAQAARDMEKIVAEHHAMWGSIPYREYLFLNVLGESGGGLEHDESTLILSSRWTFRSDNRYKRWLGTVSHEFFHTWNVRTMRPKALVEYDYEQENYFPSLWIAEGITSYYDDLALVRAGIVDEKGYLEGLRRTIEGVESTPGREVQSLRDASHDAWIKYYRPDENSRNTTISYYSKGAVVAFLLDAEIRLATDGAKSLDDLMRLCYQRFADGVGFEEAEFRAAASEVAGQDLDEFFATAVDSTEPLDYQPALDCFGLIFKQASDEEKRLIGWSTSNDGGRILVSRVERSSPAAAAGVNVDDELIGINGYRLSDSNEQQLMELSEPGESIDLLLVRRGRLMSIEVTPVYQAQESHRLQVNEEADERQTANRQAWLSSRVEGTEPEGE